MSTEFKVGDKVRIPEYMIGDDLMGVTEGTVTSAGQDVMNGESDGYSVYVRFELPDGTYTSSCFEPDVLELVPEVATDEH